MILQALKDYYDRKAADPESGIAPLGWERKGLPFVVEINMDGKICNLRDTRKMVGKRRIAYEFLLPRSVVKTSGVKSNLLWENPEYAFGFSSADGDEKVRQRHEAFVERLREYENVPDVAAVLKCVTSSELIDSLQKFEVWHELISEKANLTFSIAGQEKPVFNCNGFTDAYNQTLFRQKNCEGICSITGQPDEIPLTHGEIIGVWGTKMGLKINHGMLITYNWSAANSYGGEQSRNSRIGSLAAFAYTTALNTLLARDSRQKIRVGDATVVFWADRDTSFEDEMASIFDDSDRKDDPDALTGAVSQLLSSVKTGSYHEDRDPTRFFVLGLAPNSARISVRFWHQGTVEVMSGRFASWFEDLMIIHRKEFKDHLSIYRLLCSVAPLGKSENIPPNLAGNVMRAILDGTALPETLLQGALRRERIERRVSGRGLEFDSHQYARMKLIKACLNRKLRKTKSTEKEITIMLDRENTNIGYRLGRLFATLERIQEKSADTKLNSTIRDKYYAAASSTPATVFGTLMRLSSSHLAKLGKKNPGWKVSLEKLLGEITYKDDKSVGVAKFPAHLKLDDQGQFAIGYYHQRQDFFAKKEDVETTSDK